MSNLNDNVFDIKDLYVVELNPDFVITKSTDNDFVKSFNSNFKFIVERFTIPKKESDKLAFEVYTEVLTVEDLSKRENNQITNEIPSLFLSLEPIPTEFFTEEEIKSGKVRTTRLYKIFQDLNYQNLKEKSFQKVKK